MNVTFAIRMAITSGAAFTILPDFLAEADLASGKLQRLLPDWSLRRGGVYTVTASGRVRGNALRAFLAMAYGRQTMTGPGGMQPALIDVGGPPMAPVMFCPDSRQQPFASRRKITGRSPRYTYRR